jgi:hypothetical protein
VFPLAADKSTHLLLLGINIDVIGVLQAADMFQEAESLLCCEDWPAAQQLLELAAQQLPCICDVKALEDCCYYKLNNTKVGQVLEYCCVPVL